MEFIILPPARYPDLFPVLNVLVSTPVFGLVWLWSIKSGIEVGWAVVGLGSGNPGTAHTNANPQSNTSSSVTNLTNVTPKAFHSHPIHHDEAESPSSATDQPLSPLWSFNRRIGSPPAILGPHRPGVRERTWSSASVNTNARRRGTLPVGPGWDRPVNLDRVEQAEGGDVGSIQGLGLNLDSDGQGENSSDRKRSRGQSLGALGMRKRVPNLPGNAEGLPPPSD